MTCMNCKNSTDPKFVFQGVEICKDCFKIVSHLIAKAKKEMEMTFLVYTDMLRVALIKGNLRPPVLPESGSMPTNELRQALLSKLEKLGEFHGQDHKT